MLLNSVCNFAASQRVEAGLVQAKTIQTETIKPRGKE